MAVNVNNGFRVWNINIFWFLLLHQIKLFRNTSKNFFKKLKNLIRKKVLTQFVKFNMNQIENIHKNSIVNNNLTDLKVS